MSSDIFTGYAHGDGGHSVSVAKDITGLTSHTDRFNLCDRSGDHTFTSKKYQELTDEIKASLATLRKQAKQDLSANIDYAAARRHDTSVDYLRYAFLVTVGRGGYTIYVDEKKDTTSRIEGYVIEPEMMSEIDRLGIPYIDSTVIDYGITTIAICGPMPCGKPDQFDPSPWGSISYTSVDGLASLYAAFGAIVKNITPAAFDPKNYGSRVKEVYAAMPR